MDRIGLKKIFFRRIDAHLASGDAMLDRIEHV
jgi:hypothetical protein